ncbi:hypothetical protein WJX84_003494 [Apatococcus fuscideae]|uniref:Uncharacterized protein n=1 Tax=Apatococcus fuscideae TaxID=2026836 RepID=A0AAW1SI95_9CHLO
MLVHPDKCHLPQAAEAFKLVMKAAEHIATADGNVPPEDLDSADGPKWWQVWDETPAETEKKRKRTEEDSDVQERILKQCSSLSTEDLQKRVAVMQHSVLRPSEGSLEGSLSMLQRQTLLRNARHLLAVRLSAHDAEASLRSQPEASAGGFL